MSKSAMVGLQRCCARPRRNRLQKILGAGDDVLLDAGLHVGNQFRRLALVVIRDVDQVGGAGLRALRQLGLSRWPA